MSYANEHKILPFDSPDGPVPGHAILAHKADWMGTSPRKVVFWTFDREAECSIEIVIDVYDLTKFLKRSKSAHSVRAVILDDGTRLAATSRSVAHSGDAAYEAAPILCRGTFKIVGLCNGETFFEVAGVNAWCYGRRRPEDAALILNPWARDNAEFEARMAALNAA